MTTIRNQCFDEERALYGSDGVEVISCLFDGPADGESALKESRNIAARSSRFNLRYPFWHDEHVVIDGCELTPLCRAAAWYSRDVKITDTRLHGIKALRECADVRMEVPISMYEAALGAQIDVPTPEHKTVLLKVPAGTQDGKTFRFKDLGAPNVKRAGSRGALYVTVRVKVPTRLTSKERDALQALSDADKRSYREEVDRNGA